MRPLLLSLFLLVFASCQQTVLASENEKWQQLMRSGGMAANRMELPAAVQAFDSAESEAKSLGDDEQYLTFIAKGELAEQMGDYKKAESSYRSALLLSPSISVLSSLCAVLAKSGRAEEAAIETKSIHYLSAEEEATIDACMPSLEATIKSEWKAMLPSWATPGKPARGVGVVPFDSWTRTIFRVHPGSAKPVAYIADTSGKPKPVAYVTDSSGDPKLDQIALTAVESADLSKLAEVLVEPVTVEFTFEVGMHSAPTQGKMKPSEEARYLQLRNIIGWQQTSLGANHPEVAVNLSTAAALLVKGGQKKEARQAYLKAVEILEGHPKIDYGVLSTYLGCGELLLQTGDNAKALPVLRRAAALPTIVSTPNSRYSQRVRKALLKVLNRTGNKDEARKLQLD